MNMTLAIILFRGRAEVIQKLLLSYAYIVFRYELDFRLSVGLQTSNVQICVRIFNTSISNGQMTASSPELQSLSFTVPYAEEKQQIDHSALIGKSNDGIAETQQIRISTSVAQFKLCIFRSCTPKMTVTTVTATQLQTYLGEQMQMNGFVVTISEQSADALVAKITFPVGFGDVPLLEVITTPSDPLSVQVSEVQQGLAPINGIIRPTYMGYPSMLTYPVDGTIDEVRSSYMSLRQTICPQRLTNVDRKKYVFVEDFEAPGTGWRTADVPAFCGSYSLFSPYWFNLPAIVDLARYPYLCFAVLGKVTQNVMFKYNAIGVKSRQDNYVYTHTTNMSYSPDKTCVHVAPHATETVLKYNSNQTFLTWTVPALTRCSQDSVNTLSSNVTIIRDARWPDGVQSTITRLQRAMNPPNGTISLSFMGIPLPPFPFNFVSSGIIKRALETHPLLTNVKVNTYGACWDWKVNVEFTSRGGDQPLLEISDRSDVTGDNVTVKIQEINKGYLKLCPIPGDMLAKVEKEPQVRVYLNNVPTTCASSCAHVLSEAMKPTISNVSLTGTSEYVLRITGTGFNASRPDANELHWLGSDNQTVEIIQAKIATETQLEFYSLPQAQIKAGSQKARLRVDKFGFTDAIDVDLGSDEATITSITPSTSTLGGNIAVDIVGARFDPHTLRVRLGAIECPVKTANATAITCLVPEKDSNGDVAVTVEQLGIVISGSATFNYDATITPVLSSAYPSTSIPLAGGLEVTVNGSNFVEGCTVSIGEVTVNNFTAKSETQLIFHAPRQARTGGYPILVWRPAGGRSISNVNLTYVLNVVNVSERWGSWMGGKILNVDGNGFSPFTKVFLRATDDQVYTCVGPREAACETIHWSSTQIQCRLQPTKRVHKITNSDTNPNYGANYKWNPSTLVIIQGDTVHWEWTSPLTTKPISVYQVKSVLEPVAIPDGFSGQISSQGRYSKEFLVPGTYIYASGADYVMIGAIRVLPFGDCLTEVVVRDGETEAEHIQVKPPPLDAPSLTCPGPAPCTALANSSLMSSRYTFVLRGCLTPTVDSFVPYNGAADTTITINAPAMANCPDMVEVRMGGAMCNLLTEAGVTNSTYLSCKIGDDNAASASLLAGAPLQLEVLHREMGYPIVVGTSDPLSRIFFFLPQISASNVVQNGSILGGALGDGQGITCTLNGSLPYGENSIALINRIRGAALISNTLKLTSGIKVDSVTPSMGSFAGGTLVCLTGNGLDAPNIEVRFGDNICTVSANINKTSNQLCCLTPQSSLPLDGGSTTVVTVSGQIVGSSTPSQLANAYTYSTDYTPQITGALVEVINKSDDSKISQVTISGTLLTAHTNESVDVTLGDALRCQVTEQTDSQVLCTTNNLQAGTYLVNLVNPGSGRASSTIQVTVALNLTSVTPNSGSLLGDQTVTLVGTGFAGNLTNITICGKPCGLVHGNSVDLQCRTARSATSADALCDVVASIPGSSGAAQTVTLSNAFSYLGSWTPTVISVQPLTGGTGGGTMVTIQGNSLSAPNGTQVQIGESECIIQSASATTIVCQTGPHLPAGKVTVNVIVGDKGRAAGNFVYYYVDRWSSPYTWNNSPPPIEDDFVVIGEAQQVMLDQDTPVLTMVLISGGTLFFDPSKDVELKAKYIVVINNGKFQIGTEAEPHPSQATVTLFGHVREKELPLFGAKVLALRNGTFDLHGMPRVVTWTRLAQTADVGSQTLVLTNPVDWQPGEKIVITSTGGRNSHGENEEHEIQSVSADNRTLTLVGTIAYRKLSLTINYTGGVSGFFSAEVGLLTRNVVIRGDSNSTVPSSVPQCPADFSTGQFATQTCYQGNPTDQMGVDQFGGHLHIGGPIVNSNAVGARISYVEFTYMGQAFRLGRYPIHFHLNGRMNGTYVKGCSIHTAFNRAINVHNTHQVLIENNVVHDVMGGALFLEDGLEQENVIQYNLFVHVKKTSSLLTDDVVPAAYWITHPYNIVRHNVAAGGTNFGFWYRMLENPSGPSTTTTVCPRIARMGVFENNTVHSQGWFALWIHEIYYPTTDGVCGSVKWDKAVFRKLFAWNNNKGPECVNCGNVQFEDMLLVNNVEAGIEGKLLKNSNVYNQSIGPVYRNVYVVGHEESINSDGQKCNSRAVIPPWSPGLRVEDMTMRNFNGPNCTAIYGTVITCQCILLCGGYEYRMKNITWENTDNRAEFRWASDFVLRDEDSSLVAGISGLDPMNGALIMPYAPHLPTEKCGPTAQGAGDLGTAYGQGAVRGVRCQPEVTAIRYSVDVLLPTQAVGSDMLVTILGGGTQTVPFKKDGLTEKKGWMTTLVNNYTFEVGWRSQPSFTNLSYVAHVENFRDYDYVIVRHVGFDRKPDRVRILLGGAETVASTVPLDSVLNDSGAHYYNETGKYLEYLLKCPPHPALFVSTQLKFTAYACFYPNCTSPEVVRSSGSLTRPADAVFWSNASTWTGSLGTVPTNGSSLIIPSSTWLVLDTSIAIRLVTIVIEGSLEIISGTVDQQKVYDMSFNQMLLKGGRLLAGITPEAPLTNANLTLTLLGSINDSDAFSDMSGPTIGPKSIANYGQMLMHADRKIPTWTRLARTAEAGSNQLVLETPVNNWKAGERIAVATTSKDYLQCEIRTIHSISDDNLTITLIDQLQYTHLAYNEVYGKYEFKTGAEVAILSSNIVIRGDETSDASKFGGRILVSGTLIGADFILGQLKLSGIALSGSGHRLIHNAIIRTGWSGETATGEALSSPDIVFQAGVDIFNAPDTVLQDVAVAGAERIGLMTKGFSCSNNVDQYWQRVVVHSCMVGILITDVSSNCTTIANVKVYSATEFSVYFHVTSSIIGTNMQLVDNRGGIYTYVGTPNGRSGEMHGKTVQLQNSLLVGHSGLQLCTDAPRPEVIKMSPGLKGIYSPTGGPLGVVSSQFLSAMPNIVTMGLVDWTSDFSLGGGSFIRTLDEEESGEKQETQKLQNMFKRNTVEAELLSITEVPRAKAEVRKVERHTLQNNYAK
ncbi:hypothetical protein FGIG_04510 [Fasciola gigantica]|uniref:G8 domain-containing protein n=1 Tax=Fasciola gigantica TaxID=46835 RepID=A0A504Z4R8_FASGI|nr:hypothetical protein FGIG_04510 [Fasciola gigantica]